MKTMQMLLAWRSLWHEQGEHWLMETTSGRLSLKDNSADRPEDTDDGILWLDVDALRTRVWGFPEVAGAVAPFQGQLLAERLSLHIPLFSERGKRCGSLTHPKLVAAAMKQLFGVNFIQVSVDLKTVQTVISVPAPTIVPAAWLPEMRWRSKAYDQESQA